MTTGLERIAKAFDEDRTAISFLREDGDGGFAGGIYRMAREIDQLRLTLDKLVLHHDLGGDNEEIVTAWEQARKLLAKCSA